MASGVDRGQLIQDLRTNQSGFPCSSLSPRTITATSGSISGVDSEQTGRSPGIPPSLGHAPIHVAVKSPPSQPGTSLHHPRSSSLDSSGSISMPRKASTSSTAASMPSPELGRGGSNHQWQHHHYITSPASGAFTNQLTERYTCATCNKPFSRPSSLRIHSHSHTGEKPFRCPHPNCGKAFSVRSNMKRHERGCHRGSQSGIRKA
jgi:uncharacterized Zn-finger protein